jgi:DNA-binding NtrC family response regulator
VVTKAAESARIMVIDDDPALLGFTSKFLTRLGYSVVPFRNPQEAWKQFTVPGSECSLVVIGVSMPALSGEQLSRMMLEAKPEVRVLLTSGYPFDMQKVFSAGGQERMAFLHKPFTPAMLAETVVRLLAGVPEKRR